MVGDSRFYDPEIDDQKAQQFIEAAKRIGFSVDLADQTFNSYEFGNIHPDHEARIRGLLNDYSEFIIPVLWSNDRFVGHVIPQDGSAVELLKIGRRAIYSLCLADGASAPRPSWAGKDAVLFQKDAYLCRVLRGTAFQQDGLFRQGYLAICRAGIAIIGIVTDWRPQLDAATVYVFRDPYDQYSILLKEKPKESANFEFQVLTYLRYAEIEEIERVDLVRFDGLAALLDSCDVYNADKRLKKEFKRRDMPNGDVMSRLPYMADLAGFAEHVESNFWKVNQDLTYGLNAVSGTGIDESGAYRKVLFLRATGLVFVNAINGSRFSVESIFADLDAGLDAMNHLVSPRNQNMSSRSNAIAETGVSLSDELMKLLALKESGLLSEEEFQAAKSKLLF